MEILYSGPEIRIGTIRQQEKIVGNVSSEELNELRLDSAQYVFKRSLTSEEVEGMVATRTLAEEERVDLSCPHFPYEVLSGPGYLREVIGEPTSNKPGRVILMEYQRSQDVIPRVTITTRENRSSR